MPDWVVDKESDHPPGEPLSGEEEKIFESFLRERGLKFTRARRQLLHKIHDMHDHFTAEQLLERLKEDGIRASKATVYRTLSVMLECDLLTSHDFGEGSLYYEHIHGHQDHDHVFCLNCKDIVEFVDERGVDHHRKLTGELGFEMVARSLKIYGLCAECRELPGVRDRYVSSGVVRHRS